MIVSLLTLGLLLIPSSNAFFRLPCAKPVINTIADPIVNPGMRGTHLHTVMGSSAFGMSTTFEDQRKANCTTCKVKDDMSLYWVSSLLYQFPNGTFKPVEHGGMLVYYLQRGADNETVHEFPDGLRMVVGDANVRNYTGSDEAKAISYACINFNAPAEPQTPGFGNMDCPDGFRGQAFFMSCWDGKNLDSPDHKSHMRFPSGIDNGVCPMTHPVRLVSIFYEVWFDVKPYVALNDGGRFVLSTGDTTGYSYHADFMNGWNRTVLSRAVAECNDPSGQIEHCGVFANENRFESDEEMNSCAAPNPFPGEDYNGLMEFLPGCRAVTSGPEPATPADLDPRCKSNTAAKQAQGSGQSTSTSPMHASSSSAKPPPKTKPTSGHPTGTTHASSSGTHKPMVSGSPAPGKPPSGNNGAVLSPASGSTATKPGFVAHPSNMSPGYPAYSHSPSPASGGTTTKLGSTAHPTNKPPAHPANAHSSPAPKPKPTGHVHHDTHHAHHPQKHGHHSEQHGHHYEQYGHQSSQPQHGHHSEQPEHGHHYEQYGQSSQPQHGHQSSQPQHGHPSEQPQRGHYSEQYSDNSGNQGSDDMEHCNKPATSKRDQSASVPPMHRRHHARRAGHGSDMDF